MFISTYFQGNLRRFCESLLNLKYDRNWTFKTHIKKNSSAETFRVSRLFVNDIWDCLKTFETLNKCKLIWFLIKKFCHWHFFVIRLKDWKISLIAREHIYIHESIFQWILSVTSKCNCAFLKSKIKEEHSFFIVEICFN